MEATLTAPRPDVATAAALTTAEELLSLPHRGQRYELIQGELKQMSPAAPRHGRIAMRLGAMIEQHTRHHDLGIVYAAETGFKLREKPDTVRAADAAFVAKARIPPEGEPEGFWAIAPDLVVEVVSPSDAALDIQSKVTDWLAAGCRLVWVVYPDTQTVVEYHSPSQIRMLSVEQTLDGGEVLPGFACPP
ncbi:MAG: Uma2 family endonuclease [Anaerolineales bacterium]|nr:Uma2 family endonuclease [Anaerolineales bacterium]